jgi:hypothetical protein
VAIDVDISGVAPPEDVIGLVAVTDVTPPLVYQKLKLKCLMHQEVAKSKALIISLILNFHYQKHFGMIYLHHYQVEYMIQPHYLLITQRKVYTEN